MPFRLFAATLFALFLSACNPMEQVDEANQSIEAWHETYNSGDARALYGQTAQEFREVTSIDQMNQLVELVTDRMGKVQSSERSGININTTNGVTTTVVTMATVFEKGEGTETFTFQGTGDDTKIVGWNVDSPAFLAVPEDAVTTVDAPEEASAEE